MKLNLNDPVRVRLKPAGREIFCKAYGFRLLPKEDAEGWCEFQLWDLMQLFGPHLYLGCDPPLETTIEVPTQAASRRIEVVVTRRPLPTCGVVHRHYATVTIDGVPQPDIDADGDTPDAALGQLLRVWGHRLGADVGVVLAEAR